MIKKFKMMKNYLEVIATHEDKLNLPIDGKQEAIGTFSQVTTQKVDLDKVKLLHDFIEGEETKALSQIESLKQQLEPLKDIESIDGELVSAAKESMGRGQKAFREKLKALNLHIEKLTRKNQITEQLEFLEKNIVPLSKELKDLKKVIKC